MADPPPAGEPGHAPAADPGELVSAGSALVLLVLMFAVKWFGVDELPGKTSGAGRATAVNAWHELTIVRWLMLLTIVVAVGSLLLHATQRTHGTTTNTAGFVTILGTVTTLVLIYRVLIELPSPDQVVDQKLGAVLAILSALGIALGGHASLRRRRAQGGIGHRSRPQKSGVARRLQAR